MPANRLESTRNIGVLAHIDAGKTTCSERLLFYTGRIHRMGEVHHGQATLDTLPEERRRGITISAAATSVQWTPSSGPCAGQAHRIQLIDTPGHVDFTIEVERSLRVLDGAVIVIDASQGVEPQTETVWRQADRHGVPRLAFVNKVDKVGASVARCIAELRERLRAPAVALQLPLGEGSEHRGVIDLVYQRVLLFSGDPRQPPGEEPVPAHLRAEAESARALLVERCSEADDLLLARFLDGVTPDGDELAAAIRRATVRGALVPVLCGSALKNRGIEPLLDAIVGYLPSPLDRPAIQGTTPRGEVGLRHPSDDEPLCALVFKLTHDRSLGQVAWLRLYSGTLSQGEALWNATRDARERAGRIMVMHANERQNVQKCHTGDLVAVAGLKSVRTGDTLTAPDAPVVLGGLVLPEPVLSIALEPRSSHDQDRLSGALRHLLIEDPSLRVDIDEETGRTLLGGMGELHLEISLQRLKAEHQVDVRASAPSVAYRTTLARPIKEDFQLVSQNGGHGRFARVVLVFEPLERGAGFVFSNEVVGGTIPTEFIPAVEKGVRAAMERGPRGGFPVVELRARLLDGKAHCEDSSAGTFESAGALALQEALKKADLRTLEPIMALEILVPEASLGDALGDLGARRGQVKNLGERSGVRVIEAQAPLSELSGYIEKLRTITRGRGTFSMRPSHYDTAPAAQA